MLTFLFHSELDVRGCSLKMWQRVQAVIFSKSIHVSLHAFEQKV